ncbi:MAG: hypothetical protein LAP87_29030 [Acidobacteriia bacterium]|nr:hypothetical protein [Terriglobia bacterium]
MRGTVFYIALLIFFSPGNFPAAAQSAQKQEGSKSKPKGKEASMTGCIDQQEGHYVLVNDRTLAAIADLVADGFPTEGFAKHLGHKVTVRGTSDPGEARPSFKVRTIETVSDTCAPQQR